MIPKSRRRDRGFSRWILAVGAAFAAARAAPAQLRPCATAAPDSSARASPAHWPAPLDRTITVHLRDSSLREVLDRVAVIGKIRISYSPDLLPLDRGACISANATPIGAVLTKLLSGLNLVPVAGGADQVVLAPGAAAVQPDTSDMSPSLGVLDRVVVTGSASGGPEREMTVGLDVVSGRALSRENTTTLSSTLDGYVPGVWSWTQSPSSVLASYASIRGASSFGLSYPKIYIDGIEVANPLLISRFAPDAIDRIEVIRGPQGSALYGTDAISGVINIVSRYEGAQGPGENGSIRSSAGVTQSAFSHGVLQQDHSVSLLTGSSERSADLHVTGGSIGDFIPNGYSRDLIANGSARIVGERTTLSSSARFFMQEAGSAASPLIARPPQMDTGSVTGTPATTAPQSVQEYTVGTTATLVANDRWTHSIVAGVDGYRLANVQTNLTPIPSIADSALRAAQGGAVRATLRASSVYHLLSDEATHATLTFSVEHSTLRETSELDQLVAPNIRGSSDPVSQTLVSWQNNTSAMTQANAAIDNFLFLTGGLRVEHDSRLTGSQQFAVLPMLGAAVVNDYGPLTVKLRGAYGKGVRPPSTLSHSEFWQTPYSSTTQPPLGAEEQSGTEFGLDMFLHQALSVQITRFDQRASGLIQQVAVPGDSMFDSRRVSYWLENVGQIANRGWELESSTSVSRLTASGTLSFVDSRVEKLAPGYTGDLIAGARMLQVPATTGALNLSWLGTGWFGSVGGSRALNWINYDEIALSSAFLASQHPTRELLGGQLRQYWRQYSGGLNLHASATRDIRNLFTLELRADNLLNYQRDEPDNITVVPGRTIMTGVRVKF